MSTLTPFIASLLAENSANMLDPEQQQTGYDVTSSLTKKVGDDDYRRYIDRNQGIDDIDSPDRDRSELQGVIRTVPHAHLIYKREQPDGTFEELWIYNVDGRGKNVMKSQEVRNAIIAGTDIPVGKMVSDDGEQTAEVWAVGNAELLQIRGLIN